MKDINELIQETPFMLKVLDFLATGCGSYYLLGVSCYKCYLENFVAYTSLVGGLLAVTMLLAAYVKGDTHEFYEDMMLTIYGGLNLIATYMFFRKVSGCTCGPRLNPALMMTISCGIAGITMVGEFAYKNISGKE